MEASVSVKDEIWFLRMCHDVSKAVYRVLDVQGEHKVFP